MSLSSAPKASDLEALKQKFKAADKDNSGFLNRRGKKSVLKLKGFGSYHTTINSNHDFFSNG